MDIDKPLEELIKSKPKTRRGGRGGAGPGRGGSTNARARYATNVPKNVAPPPKTIAAGDATKIIISNLPLDVTDAAVRDLMQSTVGPVKTVQMSYTATGKSTGSATVIFKNRGDANKAHTAYHNRMIDGQKPMKVEIALDMNQLQSLASRVAPPPARGAANRGRGRGGRPQRPKKKTEAELDAEMSAYKETGATA